MSAPRDLPLKAILFAAYAEGGWTPTTPTPDVGNWVAAILSSFMLILQQQQHLAGAFFEMLDYLEAYACHYQPESDPAKKWVPLNKQPDEGAFQTWLGEMGLGGEGLWEGVKAWIEHKFGETEIAEFFWMLKCAREHYGV